MKLKKVLAAFLAAAMCFSLGVTAFAAGEETTVEESTAENTTVESTTVESTTAENTTVESTTAEASTSEATTEEESSTEEASSSEEETTKEPTKSDVISLIVKLLGQIDLAEVKDTINDINEALGLPRIESFTDIPAYADALYEKLEAMGLGYGDIINGITSSDLLEWLSNLIFGGGSSDKTTVADDANNGSNNGSNGDSSESTPDTGIALGASLAAAAVLGLGGTTAFVLAKRKDEE